MATQELVLFLVYVDRKTKVSKILSNLQKLQYMPVKVKSTFNIQVLLSDSYSDPQELSIIEKLSKPTITRSNKSPQLLLARRHLPPPTKV